MPLVSFAPGIFDQSGTCGPNTVPPTVTLPPPGMRLLAGTVVAGAIGVD